MHLPPPSSDSPVTNDAGEGYSGQVFDKAPSNSPIPQSDDFKPEFVFLLFLCTCTFSTESEFLVDEKIMVVQNENFYFRNY